MTSVIFLVFMPEGIMFGSYLEGERAVEAAENIGGFLSELPIIADYRNPEGVS